MRTKFLHFFLAILSCTTLLAQDKIYYDDHSGLSSTKIGGIVQDYRGLIWIATWSGLNIYDGYAFHWLKIKPGDGNALSNDRLRAIYLAPNGNFWCQTDEDVYEFDIKTYKYKNIPEAQKAEVRWKLNEGWHEMKDRQDNIWSSTGDGVYRTLRIHHPAKKIIETDGQQARALFLDKWKRLWIGTREDEMLRIYDTNGTLKESFNVGRKIYCITQLKNGDIWMGCKPGGLVRIPAVSAQKMTAPLQIETIANDTIYDIQQDKDGKLWIATFRSGLKCCPNPMAKKPILTKSYTNMQARKILLTDNGNIVATSTNGLIIGKINKQDYTKSTFKTITRDGNNADGLSNSATMDLVQNSKGIIYIGTLSSGIEAISEKDLFSIFDNNSKPIKFRHFNDINSSLTSDFCRSLTLLNDTTLMIVGVNNVMLFNPQKDQTVNYNRLFWNEVCHFSEGRPVIMPNKDIIFGTDEGAYRVKQISMTNRGYIPPVLPIYITVNGGEPDYIRALNDTIHFKPNERNITIRYAALDYGENAFIMYRTRLDDSPWTNSSTLREVTLFDMEPGTYQLDIQSTDRYGRWVDNIKTVTIIIEPHWYETWWATLIFMLITLGIISGLIYTYIYIRKINKQRSEALNNYMALLAQTPEETDSRTEDKEPQTTSVTKKAVTTEVISSLNTSNEKEEEKQSRRISKDIKAEDQWFLDRIRQYIEKNLSNSDANIDDMATVAATSRSTLNRRLNNIIGITAAQLLIDARMQRAAQLISETKAKNDGSLSITEIAYKCGYTDPKYFSRCFKQKYGVAPSEY